MEETSFFRAVDAKGLFRLLSNQGHAGKLAEEREPHTPISIDPHFIGEYVGRYLNDELEITATREGNQPFLQVTGYGRYPVYPYTAHDF